MKKIHRGSDIDQNRRPIPLTVSPLIHQLGIGSITHFVRTILIVYIFFIHIVPGKQLSRPSEASAQTRRYHSRDQFAARWTETAPTRYKELGIPLSLSPPELHLP